MMDPKNSVRIKYVSEEQIEARVTGSVIPRKGETVRIQRENDEKNITEGYWFEVKDVLWKVCDTAERKPDVVEVQLIEPGETQ